MMEQIILIAFENGMKLAGFFGIFGLVVGLCMNILNDFGRG
jgi:hypothetical protein